MPHAFAGDPIMSGSELDRYEFCEANGIDAAAFHDLECIDSGSVRLDSAIGDDDDAKRIDFLESGSRADYDAETDSMRSHFLDTMHAVLNEREIDVICSFFGLDRKEAETYTAIGKRLGITCEGVRQIYAKAIKKMKNSRSIELIRLDLAA